MCFPQAHSLDHSVSGASVAQPHCTSRHPWSPPCGGLYSAAPLAKKSREKGPLVTTKGWLGRQGAQSSFHFFLLCCRCDMEREFSSWEGLASFWNRNLLPSGSRAKPDRKHWEVCTDDLTPEDVQCSSSVSEGQFTLHSFVTHWKANNYKTPGSSRSSLCTAAGLIFFIFNPPCKSSVFYQSLDVSPKDDSLGFSGSLFLWWTKEFLPEFWPAPCVLPMLRRVCFCFLSNTPS